MTKKTVLYIAVMVVMMLFVSVLATVLIPLWVPLLMIRPDITSGIQRNMTQRVTRIAVKQMMSV